MFNETELSKNILTGSDERTPEAVAVVITKAGQGQVPPNSNVGPGKALLCFTKSSAFESETNFLPEGQETPFPVILDYIAKRSEAENYGLIKGCPSGFISGHCEDGHRFAKELYCGKEWCPTCNGKWSQGEDMKPSHARRFSRWYTKAQQIESMGYFTFTIPEGERWKYRTKESLTKLGHDVQELLKSHGFNRGLRRWHFFGDKSEVYHPHINCLVDGGLLDRKALTAIRREYSALLGVKLAIAEYHYFASPGEKVHALTYVTRATFLNAEWDIPMALELRGFRNQLWWGSKLWNNESLWSLNNAPGETQTGMTDEQTHAVGALEQGHCPHDGLEIEWEGYHRISHLAGMKAIPIGAGYYELPRSIPPPDRLDLSGLVPLSNQDRGLSSLLCGLDSSPDVNALRFAELRAQAHRYAQWQEWRSVCDNLLAEEPL